MRLLPGISLSCVCVVVCVEDEDCRCGDVNIGWVMLRCLETESVMRRSLISGLDVRACVLPLVSRGWTS